MHFYSHTRWTYFSTRGGNRSQTKKQRARIAFRRDSISASVRAYLVVLETSSFLSDKTITNSLTAAIMCSAKTAWNRDGGRRFCDQTMQHTRTTMWFDANGKERFSYVERTLLENRFIALRDNDRRHFPLIRPRGIEKGGLISGKSIICQINKGDSERFVSLFNRIKHLWCGQYSCFYCKSGSEDEVNSTRSSRKGKQDMGFCAVSNHKGPIRNNVMFLEKIISKKEPAVHPTCSNQKLSPY